MEDNNKTHQKNKNIIKKLDKLLAKNNNINNDHLTSSNELTIKNTEEIIKCFDYLFSK